MNLKKDRLLEIIEKYSQAGIMVIGDIMLDEYIFGQTTRISREAPVLILKFEAHRKVLGELS